MYEEGDEHVCINEYDDEEEDEVEVCDGIVLALGGREVLYGRIR